MTTENGARLDNTIALMDTIRGFNAAEVGVLLYVSKRIARGREKYGELNPHDDRNWLQEWAEEGADMGVYHAIAQLQAQGKLD